MSSLFVLGFNLHGQPFESPIMNRQELINESSVLLFTYTLGAYTDILSQETRYMFGWGNISIIGLNVLINLGFMATVTVQNFIL